MKLKDLKIIALILEYIEGNTHIEDQIAEFIEEETEMSPEEFSEWLCEMNN